MVALTYHQVKYICKSCGWHIVKTHQTGCIPTLSLSIVQKCSRCNSDDILECSPTIVDRINPIEYGKSAAHTLKSAYNVLKK